MTVRVLKNPSEADLRLIDELSNRSLTPNIFYESWMFSPALSLLSRGEIKIALVFDDAENLIGMFPLEEAVGYRRLPIRHFRLWRHIHCYLGTPLLAVGTEKICLERFFEWLRTEKLGRLFFRFEQIADEKVLEHIINFAAENGLKVDTIEDYTRPFLKSSDDAETYLRRARSSKHRKDMKKKIRGISSKGKLETKFLGSEEDLDRWTKNFLDLEAGGWKGRAGTAMVQKENEKIFFQSIMENGFRAGKLCCLSLELSGNPIAMRCGFLSNGGLFSFKVTYDEKYSEYSPGVLLELENLKYALANPKIEWSDSCAAPGPSLLDGLWLEKRRIVTTVVSSSSLTGQFLVGAVRGLKTMRDLKAIYRQKKAAKPSSISVPVPQTAI